MPSLAPERTVLHQGSTDPANALLTPIPGATSSVLERESNWARRTSAKAPGLTDDF